MSSIDWPAYLDRFHSRHPGITARVLERARTAGGDPYDWVARVVPADAVVLDLACGDAPLWTRRPGRGYLGVDSNPAELAAGRRRGAPPLVRASATSLPMSDGSVDVVVCAMALQILTPLPAVLLEIRRVLRPGGRLVATIPARGPLPAGDVAVLAGLLAALGHRLGYPNDRLLARPAPALAGAGLRMLADEPRRFRYPLRSGADVDLFLASLYLPHLPRWRRRAARGYLRGLAHSGIGLAIPLRRVTATAAE